MNISIKKIIALTFISICACVQSFAINQINDDSDLEYYGLTADYRGYYVISNYDDLEAFSLLVNGGERDINAVLTADIIINENLFLDNGEFNESLDVQQLKTVTQMGETTLYANDLSKAFNGIFDGAGHIVQGLYMNTPNIKAHLFGLLGGNAVVKNIVFTDLYFYGLSAGIIGYNYGTIESIIIRNGVVKGGYCGAICQFNEDEGSISLSANNAAVFSTSNAGGICGAGSGSIVKCANYAPVTTTAHDGSQTGGIVGYIWNGIVQDCFNTGFIQGFYSVGGIMGSQSGSSTVSSCYSIGNVKGSFEVGGVIGRIIENENLVTSNCYYVNTCLDKGIYGTDVENSATPLALSDFYSSTLPEGFNSSVWEVGSAVENAEYELIGAKLRRKVVGKCLHLKNVPTLNENVYETYYNFGIDGNEDWQLFYPIYTIANLSAVARDLSANYVIMNDISVSENLNADGTIKDEPTVSWTSIDGYFGGKFSGDDHVISGLYGKGLFNKLGKGLILNVRTENCYFYSTTDYLGSIVNDLSGGIIMNCRNTSDVEGKMHTGGIGGHLFQSGYFIRCRIENCWNSGNVTGSVYPGGIIGDIEGGTLRSCCNTGNVYATTTNGGGICGGTSSSTIIDAVCNFGTVNSLHGYIGGVAMSCKNLSQSYNAGEVIAESGAGAILKSGTETDAVDCYYNSDNNTWKGIADADFAGVSTPLTTIQFCSGNLPAGFSSDYWAVREPQIVDGYKLYYYPYLKNIGEESAQIGFKRKVYSLKLHANGGAYGDDITFYVEKEGVSLPSEVVRTGYEFKGWYSNSNYTSEVLTEISTEEKGDKDIYAKWIASVYNIFLLSNGGNINSGNVASYTYGYGVMLPTDVTRTGYTFAGWYADESCSGEPVLSISLTDTGDKTFYAKWNKVPYTITLNANEGTLSGDDEITYKYGDVVALPVPTREGYDFGGWYNNSNLVGSVFTQVESTETGNKEFWAKWLVKTYKVTLETDGGTINNGNLTYYTYGNLTILPVDVTKTGHTFGGWFIDESCTGEAVLSIASTEIGDKEFYAKWTPKSYNVVLVTNNGTINSGAITSYTYGKGATLPTDITKTGYEFQGWYDNSSYDGGKVTAIASNEVGDRNFWAKWNVNSYNVTLNTVGGTINSGNITSYTYGVGATLPTDITKTGYSFDGWYDDSSDELVLSILSTETGDRSFSAQWTKIPYIITLNANEGTISGNDKINYNYGDEVTLPVPTREGYTFGGWYNNSNLVGTVFTKVESTETGNKEFWAKWEVNTYTVLLDAKGGEINSGNVASYTYNVLTILPQDVTKVGYTFEGWFDSENQKVTQISKGTIGNVTFTAKWTAKTYNVTLQTNNGTINSGNVTSYTYGLGATLPEDVTKTGYEFLGWFDNSSYDGGKVTKIADNEIGNKNFWAKWTAGIYDVTLNVAGGTINSNAIERYTYGVGAVLPTDVTKIGFTFKGWKDEEGHFALEISTADYGDKTFTAQWEQANYDITYNANDGSINDSYEATYNYGNEITLPTDVTKDGCEFQGWYDNSNFTGEAVEVISATEYGDKTFYAKWLANSYGVAFNTNEGTINSGNIEGYTYGVTAILPTDVTKDGYTFTGWYSDEECEGEVVSIISSTETGNKTFYAGWSNTAYSITLHTNDGVISSGNVTAYTFGTEEQLPTEGQIGKTGYKFDGWYDNASCSGEAVSSVASTATGDKQYWAKWSVNSYTVTFETDGGTINSGNVKNYIYGTTVVLPSDVIKLGYTFDGWYDNEACTGSSILSISSTDLGNKTFYANWIVNSYGITLVTNEGTINSGNVENYTYGEEVALPTDVTKSGYTFDGWFTNTSYLGSAVSSVLATETGDKTFYAKWSVNTYDVTLNVNGGTITNGEIDSYTYGVGAVLPLAKNMVKTGYTFVGWYANEEFAGESVTTIANNAVGEKTFYARWTINSYDVTLNANGGTINAGAFTSYEFGTAKTLPTDVTKTGYTFAGWYDNSNLVGDTFTAISNGETGNKTFYAKWNVNSYMVTLEANGGTINSGNVKNYVYGTTVVLPSDVVKTGYTFDGWYTDEDCSGEAILSILSTDLGDKTFYANWIVNTYNVTLVTYEGTIAEEQNIDSYEYAKGENLPTDVTKEGYTFAGWYTNSSYIGGSVASVLPSETGDKTFYAKWTVNEYKVSADYDKVMGTVTGEDYYEYKSTATLKAIANEGYEFVGWNDNELKDERIQLTVTKDTILVANFKEKEKVQIAGSLEIPTLKTEREATPIDLSDLFTTTEGGEVTYTASSSVPNVVSATVSEGKLFLTVYEYEGEAEITVTATLPNGEKNFVKATAEVVLACNIQVEETITNVSCYGESDGEIALKVTNAAEPYTTQWQGQTSTEDTLRNVTANAYTVVISDAENCSFTKTYNVTEPEEMKLSAKIKHPTCDNADGSITITLTGVENASFSWSDESTNQNIANLEKGDYSVVITNTETGCQIGDNYTLTEPDAPVVTVSNIVPTACNESNGAVTISASEDDLLYTWSNNKTTKNLTNVPAGDYTLSVVNPETNCTATLAVTVPSIKLKQPEIALVTVSEQTGKNLVVWLKENTDLIQRYNIYRESETANVYTKIAEVPYSELSVYEDLEANPAVTAWRYKISATDVCNEETELGEYHKTIHLMQNQGLGGVYNLDWNTYEGLDFPTYVVIRKSVVRKVVTMDTIAYLSSNNNTYTDTLPAKGTQAYYVGMVLPEEINPMTQFMKAESGPFSIALSNIAEVESDEPDAVYDLNGSNAKAYAWGHTIYVKGAEGQAVAVYDVKGRKIDVAEGQNDCEFQVRLDGVYFVKVGEYTFKVVVE